MPTPEIKPKDVTPIPAPAAPAPKATYGTAVSNLLGTTKKRQEFDITKDYGKHGNFMSRASWTKPYKMWKNVTVNPAGSAVASAALAGGAAYMAAPLISKLMKRMTPGGGAVGPQEQAEFRKRLAILAALGFGGLSVASNLDTKHPGRSMMKWNYMPKKASWAGADVSNAAVMGMDIIPLDHAKEVVANDKFLSSGQKAAIGAIFDNTSQDTGTGNTSMADLTSGAVRAGLGFAGGAVAGYALGKLFALPTPVTRAASITGGLANALRTSGLIS